MEKQSLLTGSSRLIDNSRIKNFAHRDVDNLHLGNVVDVFKHVPILINCAVFSRWFGGEKNPTQCRFKCVNSPQNASKLVATSHNNSRIILFFNLPTKLHELVRKRLRTRQFWSWTRILRASISDVAHYHYQPSRAKCLLGWDNLVNFESGLVWEIDSIVRVHSLELLQATER